MTELVARLQAGDPPSKLFEVVHRIADRLEPQYRQAFLEAVRGARGELDLGTLQRAFRNRKPEAVVRALGVDNLDRALRADLEDAFTRSMVSTGRAIGDELASELNVAFAFDATDPNVILQARRNAATLVSRISEETRLSLRAVIADMQTSGVPPARAAPRIRELVGLRQSQAEAVNNFVAQLRAGDLAAADRRLDAATKARIRSAIRNDAVTDEFIAEVQETYASSLRNRRALDIGRTETIRAGNAGQQETWRQAADRGAIDRKQTRRVWIVTPDERLRESHAAIPAMNPNGVGLEEPFDTPGGPAMYPPPGFDPVNCRCTTGLMFRNGGVL